MARVSGWLLRGGLPVAASLLILGGCETAPPGPDPMQVKVDQLDQRVSQIERVVSNQSLVQLSQRIDQLDMELRELRGEVEELQNSNDELSKQQRDYYADLNRRLTAVETASRNTQGTAAGAAAVQPGGAVGNLQPPGPNPAPTTATGASNGGQAQLTDQAAYEAAFDTLKGGNYAAAVQQFMDFLQKYPHSELADNAQYWLGEAYYVQRDYANAAAAFKAVGQVYPQSRKAPDALLKLGYTLYDQGQVADARTTLNEVLQRYPNSDAAKLAQQRLAQLGSGQGGAGP